MGGLGRGLLLEGPLHTQNTLHPSVRGAGRKILLSSRLGPRVESVVNMNERAHDNMSASHGRCENGKENEKRKWQGSSISNNTLNINLIYSCCLLHISSANSAAIVKRQSFSEIEISLHCQDGGTIYSYTVIQLCSYAVFK